MQIQIARSNRRSVLCAVLCALLLCVASASAGQTPVEPPMGMGSPSRPERPYRGLFGSPSGDSHQQLIVDGSGGVTWNGSASTNAGGSATALNSGAGGGAAGSTEVIYLYEKDRWGMKALAPRSPRPARPTG